MEPYRSTLATTAAAVCGLIVAAHVLHPGNFEPSARPVRAPLVAAVPAAPAVAWVDPPAEHHATPSPGPSAELTTLLVPQTTMVLPQAATMLPPVTSGLTTPAVAVRHEVVRRRTAQRAARASARKAAQARAGTTASASAEPRPVVHQVKADPLGDLLRGLGLGRDG